MNMVFQSGGARSIPKSAKESRLRICLAASGGGHVRQLLDLEAVWSEHDHFFVSEDTALTRSLASKYQVHFLPHFAIGQIKRDGLARTILAGIQNLWKSAFLAFKHRPDVIISTGAGTVFFVVLLYRLFGAKFILIETFARFETPSSFARAAAPFANKIIVQAAGLAKSFPNASVFDPLQILHTSRPDKKSLLFATVGVTFPFDRMISMVAVLKGSGAIPEDVVLQTGIGGLAPAGLAAFETLPYDRVMSYLREADIVICHAGTGSVITALREGCRTIVVPRIFEEGEHYDNHQREITDAFAARGLVFPANSPEELASALRSARSADPISATTNPAHLIAYLDGLLLQYAGLKR